MVASAPGRCRKIVSSFHFWVVVALFATGIVLSYPQQILSTDLPSLVYFLGLTRHAAERIFLLLPLAYASFFLGIRVGLDLAVTYGIVQRHKGKIEVQSKAEEGTTFSVYLPLNAEAVGT